MASRTHFRPFRVTSGQMLSAGIAGAAPAYGTRNLPPVSDSAGPGRPLVAPCGQDVVQVTAESRQTLVWISAVWARAGIVQNTAEMATSLLKKLVVGVNSKNRVQM